MNYEFPTITNIEDVLPAIKDRDEIIVAERTDFVVVNYLVAFADTFPDPSTAESETEQLHFAIRRECRGIKFHPHTGDLLARPFHKFFNCNEKEETQFNAVAWNNPFIILEKLDGSMIHPILTLDNEVRSCSRMGMTDVAVQADEFMQNSDIDYLTFCRDMLECGMTPLFEWCSKKQRIVLLYPEDKLVLTAIRYNKSGNYMHHEMMYRNANEYGIPVVGKWNGNFDGIERFVDETKCNTNEEGYVFRFDNGLMLKCKNDWYCEIHRSKDEIRFEKNVIRLHLEGNLDDVIPHLLEDDANRVKSFVSDFDLELEKSIHRLRSIVDERRDNMTQKEFAAFNIENYSGIERGLLFQIWSGRKAVDVVIGAILKNTNSQTQVDAVRFLFNVCWDDY